MLKRDVHKAIFPAIYLTKSLIQSIKFWVYLCLFCNRCKGYLKSCDFLRMGGLLESFPLWMIKSKKKKKNLVDLEWRQCKNIVFIWSKLTEAFKNSWKILWILLFVVAVQLCHWKSMHSLSIMIIVIEKLFSQGNSHRAVHALWPQQMVWYCATPLSVQAMGKYYGSHTQECVTWARVEKEMRACHSNYKAVLDETLETPGVTN